MSGYAVSSAASARSRTKAERLVKAATYNSCAASAGRCAARMRTASACARTSVEVRSRRTCSATATSGSPISASSCADVAGGSGSAGGGSGLAATACAGTGSGPGSAARVSTGAGWCLGVAATGSAGAGAGLGCAVATCGGGGAMACWGSAGGPVPAWKRSYSARAVSRSVSVDGVVSGPPRQAASVRIAPISAMLLMQAIFGTLLRRENGSRSIMQILPLGVGLSMLRDPSRHR